MKTIAIAAAVFASLAAGSSRAEVVDAQSNGFEVRHQVVIAAPASAVWTTLVTPAKWWASAHTWSGSAANLSLGAASGGCFCERLPNGGSVLHMTTAYAAPGAKLVLSGGLGPMGAMKGFAELVAMGLTDKVPALACIQAEGCAPMVTAFRRNSPTPDIVATPRTHIATLATGNPGRGYALLRQAIDALRAAMDETRAARDNYRALFDAVPDPVSIIAWDGTVRDLNKAGMSAYKRPRSEIVSRVEDER